MSVQSADSFRILKELTGTEFYTAFHAQHRETQRDVRLTRMAKGISESPGFRAAFRTDEPRLSTLHHTNILELLYWGEDDGILFYATELPQGESLRWRLDDGSLFSWDEFVDLGWQIASALQHAHNTGITHGRLNLDSIIISDELRVKVVGFGLYRWIAAAMTDSESTPAFSDLAKQDLIDFGNLLDSVIAHFGGMSNFQMNDHQGADVVDLVKTLKAPPLDFTARDVQGRLGNLLLSVSGESIEMIDDREGQGLSRRSLVDELFDEPPQTLVDSSRTQSPSTTNAFKWWLVVILLLLAAMTVIVSQLF